MQNEEEGTGGEKRGRGEAPGRKTNIGDKRVVTTKVGQKQSNSTLGKDNSSVKNTKGVTKKAKQKKGTMMAPPKERKKTERLAMNDGVDLFRSVSKGSKCRARVSLLLLLTNHAWLQNEEGGTGGEKGGQGHLLVKGKKLNVQIAIESKWNCYCCKDAFSPKSECTLAYCYVCYLEKGVLRTGVHDLSEKGGQGRKRVRQNGGVAKITEVGEHLYKGECGKHTLDDVDSLKMRLIAGTY